MNRYDPAPLFARLHASGMSQSELARRLGCHPSTVAMWVHRGVGENFADQAAVAVGRTPGEIWPEWLEDEIARDEARRRKDHAAAKKRWRQKRTPEQRQVEQDYLAAYRERYREYLNAQRRARYQRNRQAEIAANVARRQRKRAEQAS